MTPYSVEGDSVGEAEGVQEGIDDGDADGYRCRIGIINSAKLTVALEPSRISSIPVI